MTDRELTQSELHDQTGDLLPDREAMSLVTPDPGGMYPLPTGDLPPLVDDTGGQGAPPPAHDAAGQAGGVADADGSETRPESTTDDDRSDRFESTDTASAGGSPHTGT